MATVLAIAASSTTEASTYQVATASRSWPAAADIALQAAAPPPTLPIVVAPACPSPYPPAGHIRGTSDVPENPPGVAGDGIPSAQAGATVTADQEGDHLLLTVTLDGVTRRFTTAPHPLGSDYNRTQGPSDTGFGAMTVVYADDGAVFVVLAQNNSGDYSRFGWRFDDPCAIAASAVTSEPTFTG